MNKTNKNDSQQRRSYLAEYYQKTRDTTPWIFSYRSAKTRCENPNAQAYKRYGGRGIKLLMTPRDFEHLWYRDNADMMDTPSIDRLNNDSHYILDNCRFIEKSLNTKRAEEKRRKEASRTMKKYWKELKESSEKWWNKKDKNHKRWCSRHQVVHGEQTNHWSCIYPNDKERNAKQTEWRKNHPSTKTKQTFKKKEDNE